jgi:hypothetical protein
MHMGLLELTNAVHPVTGVFLKRFSKVETTNCEHCQSIIAIHHEGCSRDYQSKYTCARCCSSICTPCAKWMKEHGGQCPGPFRAKLEEALKHEDGSLLLTHIHKYRS